MTKKLLELYEYSLDEMLWDMYSVKEFDKIPKCTVQKSWHLFGQCSTCGAKALRFSLLDLDRVYSVESKDHLVASLKYLRTKYPDASITTRREKPLPILSTAKAGSSGFVYKVEFTVDDIFVFVVLGESKTAHFKRVQDHVKTLGHQALFLKYYPETGVIQKHIFEQKAKASPRAPEVNLRELSPKSRIARVRTRFRIKRLVNPANPSDVYYVPWNELKPLVEMYNGDRDRAERRWWRRKIRQRNKQYRKP